MSGERLHLGSGPAILEGWVNIDIFPYPGVDRVLDLRDGLPYDDIAYIFAEHFLEHLDLDSGLQFLRECRRALADDGVLRLTTPNLDWVWVTQYSSRWKEETGAFVLQPEQWRHDDTSALDCLMLNRGFRGWGHRFLYNAGMLVESLMRAGFARVEWSSYGESDREALRGIERHEQSPDAPYIPSLLIAEASGRASGDPGATIEPFLQEYLRDLRVQ